MVKMEKSRVFLYFFLLKRSVFDRCFSFLFSFWNVGFVTLDFLQRVYLAVFVLVTMFLFFFLSSHRFRY